MTRSAKKALTYQRSMIPTTCSSAQRLDVMAQSHTTESIATLVLASGNTVIFVALVDILHRNALLGTLCVGLL